MELETIDDSPGSLPQEAIIELKKMSKWMTFTGVLTIIFTILSILGNLGNFAKTTQPIFLLSIVLNLISLYLGFMIIKKSGLFTEYADTHDENKLVQALKVNKNYWMVATLMLIVSFILSFNSN